MEMLAAFKHIPTLKIIMLLDAWQELFLNYWFFKQEMTIFQYVIFRYDASFGQAFSVHYLHWEKIVPF